MAIPFLQSIATAYASRLSAQERSRRAEYCFVFPNKRAGTFFLKYLRDAMPDASIAPCVTTISDLVADLSGRFIDNRIDLLFILYRAYCRLLDPEEKAGEIVSFDSFRRWGDTVLRDFNEVDIQNVDPEKIFKNVADFKEITSSFLTDEQRAVMEEYFGYRLRDYDTSSLWLDSGNSYLPSENSENSPTSESSENSQSSGSSSKADIRAKFISLWKVLAPLYRAFHARLAELGLTTSGGAYRLALRNLSDAIDSDDPSKLRRMLPYDKIVMIGFNALSMSERALFSLMQSIPSPADPDERLTDFIWDSTGPILSDRDNSAGRFVAINRRDFPQPDWIRSYASKSDTSTLPSRLIRVAAPSKVMQVKIASERIADLMKEIGEQPFREAKVALVVPDESLLLPLLYSLPKNIKELNLTMGYPLRLTAVTSFLQLLRSLQLMRRDSSQYQGYAFDQLRDLLSHPYSHSLFTSPRISAFCHEMERRHARVVRIDDLRALGPNAMRVLAPIPADASPAEVIAYLDNVLAIIGESIDGSGNSETSGNSILKGDLELCHVRAWRDALRIFADSITEHGIRMNTASTLAEAYRLLRAEIVAFEGEPLKGLQIMGMLETRALDFDHVIIIGLNDRTIPGRQRQRSFIPNIIRAGFGMPPNTYQEDLFGYYFYRLLSRTSDATMIFDNRVSGLTGGESRYLLQLRYLYARDRLKDAEYKFTLTPRRSIEHMIEKTPKVMEALERYRRDPRSGERRKNLSASLMKKFTACELKFYFQGVLDINDDPAPTKAIDPITYGNIIHAVIEELYLPDPATRGKWLEPPILLTAEKIDSLIANRDGMIERLLRRHINADHYRLLPDELDTPLEADAEIIAAGMKSNILDVLRYDRGIAPISLYGCEIKGDYNYTAPDGRRVNLTYIIDRVDKIDRADDKNKTTAPADTDADSTQTNATTVRIIDYKTGSSHITADSIEDIFSDNYNNDNLLQLLIYSHLLNLSRIDAVLPPLRMQPMIYPVGKLCSTSSQAALIKQMVPSIGGEYLEFADAALPEFTPRFDKMLDSIFSEGSFHGKVDDSSCRFCPFFDACRR